MVERQEIDPGRSKVLCVVCGTELRRKSPRREKYQCPDCGESYDLEKFRDSEIDMTTFDKLLLHYIRKRPRDWR